MYTVGYQGNIAIVDGTSKRKYGKLSVTELMEKGLYKPALCAAIYSKKEEVLEEILSLYNEKALKKLKMPEDLFKVFGVNKFPDEIEKVILV